MKNFLLFMGLISFFCVNASHGDQYLDGSFHISYPPAADGHYNSSCTCCCGYCAACSSSVNRDIVVDRYSTPGGYCGWIIACDGTIEAYSRGIIEFNIRGLDSIFNKGHIEAELSLRVKRGDLPWYKCFNLYNIQDTYEDGVIERADSSNYDYIDESCENLPPGGIITFDVTSAIEHDLFAADQTFFSGFVITAGYEGSTIKFYDHTHPMLGPQLRVSGLCPVSVIYGTSSGQTKLLRYFRDNVLNQTSEGRELIKLYYLWSPTIVKAMEQDEAFKEEIKQMIDYILPMLEDAMW